MKSVFAFAALFASVAAQSGFDSATLARFDEFTQNFSKTYKTEADKLRALENFQNNLIRVANERNPAHGITKFFDMSPEDFKATYLNLQPRTPEQKAASIPYDGSCTACKRFPDHAHYTLGNFDWTTKGAVVPIKDQGQCGSCWAFGTVADMEGTHFLAGNPLTSLSEQQLVSCDTTYGDQGCNGGLPNQAMEYAIANGGLVGESTYPYTSGGGSTEPATRPSWPAL